MELSTVASIAANLSGLLTGGLYLFLRGNRRSKARSHYPDILAYKGDEKWTRQYVPSTNGANLEHNRSSSSASSVYSQSETGNAYVRETSSATVRNGWDSIGYMGSTTGLGTAPDSSSTVEHPVLSGRDTATSRQTSFAVSNHSLPRSQRDSTCLLPSTTYSPTRNSPSPVLKTNELLVPPPLFQKPKPMTWHQRNSSAVSSQTVQIGLRVSNMKNCAPSSASRGPSSLSQRHPTPEVELRWKTPTPSRGQSVSTFSDGAETGQQSSVEAYLNKGLPQIPRSSRAPNSPLASVGATEETKLSPTVYTPTVHSPHGTKQPPRVRLASPRGVGFQMTGVSTPALNIQAQTTPGGVNTSWI